MLVVTSVMVLLGRVKLPLDVHVAVGELGVDLHADQAVAGDEGPQPQLGAGVEKLDALRRGGLRDGGADVALLVADVDFRPLLVQHHQPRLGDDVGVADLLQGVDEGAHVAVEEAEFQAAVSNVKSAQRWSAACPSRTSCGSAEQLEIDAELVACRRA